MSLPSQPSISPDDPASGWAGGKDIHSLATEGDTFQHYQVLRREDGSLWELGRGAMGVTYKAFDTNLRCPVALKVISAHYIHSDLAGQRFIREARIAARVRHPNIATVYHLGTDPQGFFYSMEFIDGETLETLVERVGPLPLETVLRIGLQVSRALVAASRQGLIHRDIKPANLMVVHQDEEGEDRLFIKMIDFGLARSYGGDDSHPQLTSTGFVGTPLYASPEQLEERDLDVRSDIYSLGVTLWILLTGRPPFAGKMTQVITQHLNAPPPWWQLGECSDALRELLERMLHKNRLERYQTATELRVAIEGCLRCITGKDVLPAEGADPVEAASNSISPASATPGTKLTGTVAGDVSTPRLLGMIASNLGAAVKSHANAGLAVLRSPSRAASDRTAPRSSLRWRPTVLRSPLVGVLVAALCIGGFVYWYSGKDAPVPTSSAPKRSLPKIVQAPIVTSVQGTVASAEPAPQPVVKPEPSPAETPAPLVNPPQAGPEIPGASLAASDPKLNQSVTKSSDDATPAPDGLASLDGSPTSTPAASGSPTPAAPPAMNDALDKAPENVTGTPAKSQASTTRSGRSRRNRPTPTPTPSFLQKLFGIKPKPKSK